MIMFLIGCLYAKKGNSQIMPAEGSKLNYILAQFSIPRKQSSAYEFRIAKGIYSSEKAFSKNISIVKSDSTHKTSVQLPAYGSGYTWQVSWRSQNKIYKTGLYHFYTDTSSYTDTSKYRLRVIENTYADSTLLFFLDYSRVLYNMNGIPVWFLPNIPNCVDSNTVVRDLKATHLGTITFLTDKGAYEINYDGDVLWSAPVSENKVDNEGKYHHEFTRLKNGNYMLMAYASAYYRLPQLDSAKLKQLSNVETKNGENYVKVDIGSLVEYNSKKELVWSWKAKDHIKIEDFLYSFDRGNGELNISTHMNAFYFDEEKQSIYVGFKDMDQFIQLKYPDGNILSKYGSGSDAQGNGFFKGQHSINRNKEGDLYVFNNNMDRNIKSISSVIILKEPLSTKDPLEKIWEFRCDIDTNVASFSGRGGNVVELKDQAMLVCMGIMPRIFIVNKHKQVLFNAVTEYKDKDYWQSFSQYRTSPAYFEKLLNK